MNVMQPLSIYRINVDRVIADLSRIIEALIIGADISDREAAIKQLTPVLTTIIRSHRARVYDEGVQMLIAAAEAQGVDAPYIPNRSGYPEQAVSTVLRERLRGTPQEASRDIVAAFSQHVESAGRQVIVRAVEDGVEAETPEAEEELEHTRLTTEEFQAEIDKAYEDGQLATVTDINTKRRRKKPPTKPVAWARVLTGIENCGFCVMLASRGPVYASVENAGKGSDGANRYHTNCDCVVTPVYDYGNWPGREQYKALENLYVEVVDQEEHRKANDVVNAIDRHLRAHPDALKQAGVQELRQIEAA